jgi:hypothetical protein
MTDAEVHSVEIQRHNEKKDKQTEEIEQKTKREKRKREIERRYDRKSDTERQRHRVTDGERWVDREHRHKERDNL